MGGYNSAGVSAIPEPSTWLLMMASGLVATARPRRTGQQGSGEGLVKLIELAISKTAGEVKRPDMGVPPTGTKPDEAPGEVIVTRDIPFGDAKGNARFVFDGAPVRVAPGRSMTFKVWTPAR